MLSTAAFTALALQCAVSVHPDTAYDVAKTESGFHQFAIGVVNGNSIYPSSLKEANKVVDKLVSNGRNFSIGLMQINQANFSKYGVTSSELFDPCKNLQVFEKIIADCYKRGGSLKRALSCYYSGNFETGFKSEKSFSETSYVERIGYKTASVNYAVPSTKAERMATVQPESLPSSISAPTASKQVWPQTVVRGSLPSEEGKRTASRLVYPSQVIRGTLFNSSIAKETE